MSPRRSLKAHPFTHAYETRGFNSNFVKGIRGGIVTEWDGKEEEFFFSGAWRICELKERHHFPSQWQRKRSHQQIWVSQ